MTVISFDQEPSVNASLRSANTQTEIATETDRNGFDMIVWRCTETPMLLGTQSLYQSRSLHRCQFLLVWVDQSVLIEITMTLPFRLSDTSSVMYH